MSCNNFNYTVVDNRFLTYASTIMVTISRTYDDKTQNLELSKIVSCRYVFVLFCLLNSHTAVLIMSKLQPFNINILCPKRLLLVQINKSHSFPFAFWYYNMKKYTANMPYFACKIVTAVPQPFPIPKTMGILTQRRFDVISYKGETALGQFNYYFWLAFCYISSY